MGCVAAQPGGVGLEEVSHWGRALEGCLFPEAPCSFLCGLPDPAMKLLPGCAASPRAQGSAVSHLWTENSETTSPR